MIDDEGFGCSACRVDDAFTAQGQSTTLEPVASLVDESRFIVRVAACGACGQRFLTVLTESIDWHDGDDPSTRERMPLREHEFAALDAGVDERVLEALAPPRRRLVRDWPQGAPTTTYLTRGLRIGRHDRARRTIAR